MNTDFAILLFWFGISVTANIGLTFAWFHMRKRVRQLESRPVDLSQLDDLAARVQNSLDTLSAPMDHAGTTPDFPHRVPADHPHHLEPALPVPEPHDTPR